MNITRPLVLAAAVVTFVISGCSQPRDVVSPTLEPQFGSAANDYASGLANYGAGVYVVGNTSGKLHATNKGATDAYIRKVDTSGKLIWGRQFGTAANEHSVEVATDASGNAYVFGSTEGSLARPVRGSSDFFLRKYSATGKVAWTLQFGLDTQDIPGGLVVSGNYVYVVGAHQDIGRVLYKFNLNSGSTSFKRQFAGGSRYFNTTGITTDSSGNVYVASSIEVPCGYEDYDDCSNVLMVKLNPAGTQLWSKQLNFPGGDGIAQDNSVEGLTSYANNLYLITDAFDVPNDDSVTRLMKLDTTGAVKWERYLASAYSYELGYRTFDLSADSTGIYTGTTTYYNSGYVRDVTYSYAKYRADGQPLWRVDGPDSEPFIDGSLNAISAGGRSGLYIAGAIDGGAGRSNDAYLKRLNASTGSTVWTR